MDHCLIKIIISFKIIILTLTLWMVVHKKKNKHICEIKACNLWMYKNHIYLFCLITCLAVSSTPPPPSSEPVWVAERTLLSEPHWCGSSGPEPRRSRQSHHRQFFSSEVKKTEWYHCIIFEQKDEWFIIDY